MLGPVESFFGQVTERIGSVAANPVEAGQRAGLLLEKLVALYEQINHTVLWGLLPACFVLLLLHEQYTAQLESRAPRIAYIFWRSAGYITAYMAYGQICSVILSVAQAGDGWLGVDKVGAILGNRRLNPINYASGDIELTEPSTWFRFLMVFGIWLLMMCTVLFAYVMNLLLSLIQNAYIAIILAAGPIMIVLSMVPGVALAKSWAKALAQTAAWSFFAGVIATLLSTRSIDIQELVAAGDLVGMLKASANFIVLGLCTASIPMITARVMAGGSPAAAAVGAALFSAYKGASSIAGAAMGVKDGVQGAGKAMGADGGQGGGGDGGGFGQGLRPHKQQGAGGIRGAVGAVVAGGLSPMTSMVAGLRNLAGKAPDARGPSGDDWQPRARGSKAGQASEAAAPSPPGAREAVGAKAQDGAVAVSSSPKPLDQAVASRAREVQVPGRPAGPAGAGAAGAAPLRDEQARGADSPAAPRAGGRDGEESAAGQAHANGGGGGGSRATSWQAASADATVRGGAIEPGRGPSQVAAPAAAGMPAAADAGPRMGPSSPAAVGAAPPARVAPPVAAAAASPAPHASPPPGPAPAAVATARNYPPEAVTPLALRDHKVSPHIVRRPMTEPQAMPAALRVGGLEDPNA